MSLPEGISDLLPLSPAQQGMLFHIVEGHQTHARYVAVISLRIKGVLVADRLKQAIEQTVNAHDTLRASFIYENVKTPVQAIREAVELPFETLDWSDKPDTDSLLDALILEEQSATAGRLPWCLTKSSPAMRAKHPQMRPGFATIWRG